MGCKFDGVARRRRRSATRAGATCRPAAGCARPPGGSASIALHSGLPPTRRAWPAACKQHPPVVKHHQD
eukprot:4919979-Prymnesium_polylepis.1